jgi:hypothetical protein
MRRAEPGQPSRLRMVVQDVATSLLAAYLERRAPHSAPNMQGKRGAGSTPADTCSVRVNFADVLDIPAPPDDWSAAAFGAPSRVREAGFGGGSWCAGVMAATAWVLARLCGPQAPPLPEHADWRGFTGEG